MTTDGSRTPPPSPAPFGDVPRVSVVMANFRGAAHLEAAMASVLAQSERRLELIVADDASDDDSVAIARRIAGTDERVRVIASSVNRGPAASRNLALDAARGDWIAVVDSDDLIHPLRLARLIAAAEADGADIAADDLVHFGAPDQAGRTLLQGMGLRAPVALTLGMYLRGNCGDPRLPGFGYLKPVLRRAVLGGRRYDPGLRIGEDYDLILRLLMDGARFLLLPDPLYAYRRHAGSVSHRLSVGTVQAMLAAHENLPAMSNPDARRAAVAVGRQLRRSLRYERLVSHLKARRWGAASLLLTDPAMWRRLAGSLQDRRRRKAVSGSAAVLQTDAVLPVPRLPSPGGCWDCPPAPVAARIAALAAHDPKAAARLAAASGEKSAPDAEWTAWLAGAAAQG